MFCTLCVHVHNVNELRAPRLCFPRLMHGHPPWSAYSSPHTALRQHSKLQLSTCQLRAQLAISGTQPSWRRSLRRNAANAPSCCVEQQLCDCPTQPPDIQGLPEALTHPAGVTTYKYGTCCLLMLVAHRQMPVEGSPGYATVCTLYVVLAAGILRHMLYDALAADC